MNALPPISTNIFIYNVASSEYESTSDSDSGDETSSESEDETEDKHDSTTASSTTLGLFAQPLYIGAPAGLTVFMSYLLLFQFSIRHSLTTKALEELLQLSTFVPNAALPKSVYQLKSLLFC